jgi:hypothetical protein
MISATPDGNEWFSKLQKITNNRGLLPDGMTVNED